MWGVPMLTREEAAEQALSNYRIICSEHLPALLATGRGKSVLLRDGRVIAAYESLDNAYDDGMARYPDERFSVQEVRDQTPADLGWYSRVVYQEGAGQ